MAQFTIYKSTDSSAPSLTGQTGSLVTLLDACLVNGYGSKAAAGWSKAYSGTSKAAYRQASGSNQFYLRVQDDGPGGGTFKEARMTGYETMSDVDTGTGPFPTAAQGVGSVAMLPCRKSTSADSTTRTWMVIADDRTVMIFVLTGDVASTYLTFMFGDFYSLVTSDGYRTMIIGRGAENSGTMANDRLAETGNVTNTLGGHFIARSYLGTGTSITAGKHFGDLAKMSPGNNQPTGSVAYPNPSDGGLYTCPIWISDPSTSPSPSVRGRMRGVWGVCHAAASVNDADVFAGAGTLSGKNFLIVKTVGSSVNVSGLLAIETSNTLETN